MAFRSCVALFLFVAATGVTASGPTPALQAPAPFSSEAPILAQGWAALANGDMARAAGIATQALADHPGSPAALSLAVEVDLARGGRLAGLDTYERWLGRRRVDEPHVLRRIALAHLLAASRDEQSVTRLEALKALLAEGDPAAVQALTEPASRGSFAEARVLASLGDKRAVNMLVAQMGSPGANKLVLANALAESGSPLGIPPLVAMLADARPEYRAAAAEALGRLDAREAIARIKPLLEDPISVVRIAAAGALYRVDDMSGLPLLQSLLNSQYAAVRVGAADVMSSHPDAQWQAVTRELARDSDVTVRLTAARLIAPYDPDLAASTLQGLLNDGNLTVREEAARVFSQGVARDFASLRRLLRSADNVAAVRAAARILELTR